ncbi:MAG: hypothetical protein HY017_11590 [Betaproteobacteria bacterium]|nr:hypothetical protein [Betaproteobacteria bacterium]
MSAELRNSIPVTVHTFRLHAEELMFRGQLREEEVKSSVLNVGVVIQTANSINQGA